MGLAELEVHALFIEFFCVCCLLYALFCFSLPFIFVYTLREACETALKEKHLQDISQTEGFIDESILSSSKQLEALGQVFKKAAEADTPTEVSL